MDLRVVKYASRRSRIGDFSGATRYVPGRIAFRVHYPVGIPEE